MAGQGGEKTEAASPKKRQDERKKGNIFMSKDITTVVSLVIAFYVFGYFTPIFFSALQDSYKLYMLRIQTLQTISVGDFMKMYTEFAIQFITTAIPAMVIISFVTVLIVGAQTRFLFSYEMIKFKMERIDPMKGIKKLFSLRSIVELLKSLIKITILSMLLYQNILESAQFLPLIFDWEIRQAFSFVGQEIWSLVMSVAIAFGAVAALDFLYQRFEYEKGLKMSKQEVKDEYKQMEGNPLIKSARRQKQREYATGRMMEQVKDADVVVRNPTHFAVAIKYDIEKDTAPMVLAKGKDLIALKIVELAEKHNISTVENKTLARGLYELSQIDEVIPPELYQPVAELLAWLYSTKEKEKYIK